jgi:hypothetical protein
MTTFARKSLPATDPAFEEERKNNENETCCGWGSGDVSLLPFVADRGLAKLGI